MEIKTYKDGDEVTEEFMTEDGRFKPQAQQLIYTQYFHLGAWMIAHVDERGYITHLTAWRGSPSYLVDVYPVMPEDRFKKDAKVVPTKATTTGIRMRYWKPDPRTLR